MNSSTFSINTLSDEDTLYLENVTIDLRTYIKNLHTSTHKEEIKCPDVVPERKNTMIKKVDAVPLYRPPALRSNELENSCPRKERKDRKPDMQIYVPRGRRLLTPSGGENQRQDEEINVSPNSSNQKQSNVEGLHTPKKQRMVYPPSPEKPKSDARVSVTPDPIPVIDISDGKSDDNLILVDITKQDEWKNEDLKIELDPKHMAQENFSSNTSISESNRQIELDNSIELIDEVETLYPSNDAGAVNDLSGSSMKCDVAAATSELVDLLPAEKSNGKICNTSVLCVDEESQMKEESKKSVMDISSTQASPEIKHVEKELPPEKKSCDRPASTSVSSKENSSLNVNECEWDELFDEEGEYVDKSLINELMTAIGKVSVQHTTQDYKAFQTVEERTSDGGCVIEIYGFPSEFKTDDLFAIFASYRSDPGFQIVWVDDSHALAVFSSPTLADQVLNTNYPFIKTRPIKNAIPKSRAKAQNFILPPVARPKTCVSLARRLVSGHLGMKITVTDQQKAAEKKILSDAREKRRLIAKQRQEAWDGTS